MMEKTPYELLNGIKPNIAYFWVFGCKCYILKKGTRLSKFEKKCDEGFLLGYSTTSKAYRVWNLASGTLECGILPSASVWSPLESSGTF